MLRKTLKALAPCLNTCLHSSVYRTGCPDDWRVQTTMAVCWLVLGFAALLVVAENMGEHHCYPVIIKTNDETGRLVVHRKTCQNIDDIYILYIYG